MGIGFQFCRMKRVLEVKVVMAVQQHAERHIQVFKSLSEQIPIPMGWKWLGVLPHRSEERTL